jgi:uncharacterized phage protein (TIGR02218 family)
MKTLPDGLQAHLDTGATTLCWCWRIIRADGRVYGFTDHDHDIAIAGTVYEAASGFSRSDMHASLGLSVDNVDVAGALTSEALSESDLGAGLFDGAQVEIWRVNWMAPEQRVLMMAGSVGEVRRGETAFTAELRSLAHYLNQEQGRIYQFACDAILGDARCGVVVESWSGIVLTSSAADQLTTERLELYKSGLFTHGLLTWQTGMNSARSMEVKRHTALGDGSAEIELWRSMPLPIEVGDRFSVIPGCDKTFGTCRNKFSNTLNFRGFPHIPGNGYVVAVPRPGDPANNGGSISA